MPKMDWPVKTLGQILELSYGKPLEAKDRDGNGSIPVYGANGVKAYSKKSLVAGPSIIVGRKGSAGELNFCEGPFWPLDVTYYVEHDANETDLSFLHYLLSLMDLPSLAKGVKPGINRNDVYALQTTVPPLGEQKRIVELLDAVNARVAELTACYEQARTEANNLFTSALRDALAPSDSWPVKRLGDLCLFVRGPFGGSLKKSVFVSTGHAVYEQQHAISGKFDKFRYFVSASKFQEMKRFEVFPGDILMSCSGTIGKTVIVPVGAPAGIINQALLKLSCSEKLNNQYLCVWMRSIYFQEAVFASVVGVALQNVASVAILKNIPISLPPMEQQKQIVAQLDLMRAKTSEMVAAYDAKLQAAKDLRQSILEAAFAGDL